LSLLLLTLCALLLCFLCLLLLTLCRLLLGLLLSPLLRFLGLLLLALRGLLLRFLRLRLLGRPLTLLLSALRVRLLCALLLFVRLRTLLLLSLLLLLHALLLDLLLPLRGALLLRLRLTWSRSSLTELRRRVAGLLAGAASLDPVGRSGHAVLARRLTLLLRFTGARGLQRLARAIGLIGLRLTRTLPALHLWLARPHATLYWRLIPALFRSRLPGPLPGLKLRLTLGRLAVRRIASRRAAIPLSLGGHRPAFGGHHAECRLGSAPRGLARRICNTREVRGWGGSNNRLTRALHTSP
jgi:hypothetical protein